MAVAVAPAVRLLAHDRALGARHIAGADEAGRGCLAGPLVAAGVLFDYDTLTVRHAARRYARARFARANLAALPVRSASIDVLATLQVIEHVWDHAQFVRECVRVLRPGGLLLVTTPNRLTFSPGLDEPLNPFHTKEFTSPELTGLLEHCGLRVTTAVPACCTA